ncbi:MAG: glycoside hydrolase family 88 protein [Clostridia bacterium]|jgi:unsaturated rhamnogalacturonyl hydrolase|nr:glycoside hydrolase family 88 protein [Clostridia bacterium]RGF97162.1 rhamnogalacturonyl hydrolase [Firmicutes bacterium AM55-24TS]RHP10233.1 rhamnogalacturonyl hydrolase [Firmicutes bacterium AF36-3BH]
MGYYFDDSQSINAYEGTDPQAIISSLAYRYMGQNLKHGLYYRAYTNNGIVRTTDYRYLVDFNKIFPDSKDKECVWAFTKFYSAGKSSFGWDINCFGPMVVYVNGEVAYKSDIFKERYSETSTRVFMDVEEGWNDIRIQFKKTKAGFGGQFGTWIGKWDMYTLMPTKERDGQEGFVFTELVPDDYVPDFEIGMSEKNFDKKLYPVINWSDDEMKKGQLTRMFGTPNGQYAVGYTKVFADDINNTTHKFTLDTKGETVVYIDKKEVFKTKGGKETFDATLPLGTYDIYVKCICNGSDWGYTLECDTVEFENAARVKGTDDVWMYIGTFVNDFEFPFDTASDMLHIVGEPATYWRLDAPDTFVRPYNENTLFGRWNYPLGVTMYGLLHTAIAIGSEDIKNYIKDHVQLCIDTLEYALWDKEQYGGATSIHNLLTSIDSLDDCGSFASMMLEVNKYLGLRDVKKVADYVGDYIYNHQSRLEDGTFFRKEMMHHFHNMTMWADDLYMSVPFLVRYSQFTGDQKYLDDAANQFFGFKKRLFMPEEKIMSHVYDFKYDSKTNVPWGRGNGWVVFSMTELLEVLPEDHPKRNDLIEFLNTLCEGYLALQDDEGMWHQVLNDHESYPETSCTSMFIYAFSRGIRFGWLKNPEKYVKAIYKAWKGISKTSVDSNGNVYGVCRGSEFSFIADYYKYELGWNLNDTHGTGIVMLAGIEVIRLNKFLAE